MSNFGEDINQYLKEFKKGDRSRFQEFYDKYHNYFLSWAVYYLVNKDLREDVVLDAYSNMFRSIQTFKDDEDGYNWLIKIIENVARTCNKNELKQRRFFVENIYTAEDFNCFDEVNIYADIERLFKKDYKNYIIATLVLCKGRKQEEVAKMLGISTPAVSQRMNKIRKVMENYLTKS